MEGNLVAGKRTKKMPYSGTTKYSYPGNPKKKKKKKGKIGAIGYTTGTLDSR